MKTPVNKKLNERLRYVAEIYDKTPKAVFAAVAVEFALVASGEYGSDASFDAAQERILLEWGNLYESAIVPQKPVRASQKRLLCCEYDSVD